MTTRESTSTELTHRLRHLTARWHRVAAISPKRAMIQIDAVVTEQTLAEEFIAAFRARRLDEKFFYWFPLSVRAWLALCSDGAYRNYVRSRSLMARAAPELAGQVGGGPIELVSLGAGQGDKDRLLLAALRNEAAPLSYLPVDTSQALLEIAVGEAQRDAVVVHGVKADFTKAAHRAELPVAPSRTRRLVVVLGNTLGAFDPVAELAAIRTLLRPADLLLVDGELYAGAGTVAGYDNPLNRRFAWAPLHAVGIRESDGTVSFVDRQDDRMPGLHPLAKYFEAGRACSALVGGETLAVAPGERIFMNHSYKYSREAFARLLADAGLAPRWEGTSDDGRFLMVLAAPA